MTKDPASTASINKTTEPLVILTIPLMTSKRIRVTVTRSISLTFKRRIVNPANIPNSTNDKEVAERIRVGEYGHNS
jgi:hypothetical protein